MSAEKQDVARADSELASATDTADYWNALISEKDAADFLKLTVRTMQSMRQRGGGPEYYRLSARCIRYARRDLRAWADTKICTSTADPGQPG